MNRTATRTRPQNAAHVQSATHPEDLQPISSAQPCGPSLEYDPDYAVLLARMAPRAEAQYGNFVDTPDAPNWPEVERECRRLLLRTKDINVLIWLCRARTRQAQAAGLVQALATLLATLQTWPDAVHPQLVIDDHPDPVVRANALAALADPEGLLSDLRDIVVASHTAARLTVRDVERAYASPRLPEALSAESVSQQLVALREAAPADADAPVHLLARAAALVVAIQGWAQSQLGDDAPSLQPLARLLGPFAAIEPTLPDAPSMPVGMNDPHPVVAIDGHRRPHAVPAQPSAERTREDVQHSIRAARQWFESHEPSSPVAVLLKQAERMVGKRFSEVVEVIPIELLLKWDAEEA